MARRVGDFSLRPPAEREHAKTQLTYVDMARALSPRGRSDAALLKAITETASRIGDDSPPSPRHLRRLIRRGGENPTASSYVPANAAKGNRTDRLDIRIREIVEGKINEVLGRRQKIAATTIHQRVLVAVEDLNETLPSKLPCPSYATVKRALQARSPRDLMAAREGEPAAAQAFDGVVTRKGPMKPLEVVELDHTPCDMFVIEETTFLPMGRPTIVIALDRATRMPFGMHVGFDPPSASTVMQCLRNGMLPKTYLDRKVRDGEWTIKNRWEVCGKPKTLLVDLARENVGNDLDDVAAEIKFHLRFACPIHECILVDACTSCAERFDTDPVGSPLACRCLKRFDQSEVQAAPPHAVRIARNLALMIGVETSTGAEATSWELDLPAEFTEVRANDYMAYLDVIGTAATTPAEEDRRVDGPTRRYARGIAVKQPAIPITLARIDAAMPIMDGWPAMLHCLLGDLRGRGDGPDAVDVASAFPTRVGRSLLRPRRGANGLPLHLIHEAVDQYRQLHGPKSYRKRNLTVESAAALKLHTHLNATTLAIAVGDRQATGIHARILRRVLDEMPLDELALPPADVAELALRRCVSRYDAVVAAVTGHAAARIIEGRAAKGTLSGWNHPDLLPVDPALQGLRCKDSPIYLNATVCGALERLRAASQRSARARNLSPLLSVAMKLAPLRPWFNKTALLLDVMNGTVPVYAAVDQPRLTDLFVDLPSLRDHIAARNPSLRTEYATLAKVNALLLMRFGPGSAIGLHSARRLVRTRSVGFVLEKTTVANRERPVVQRLYRINDMIAVTERGKARNATANGEDAATGIECDVTERIAGLLREGKSMRATAGALTRSGLLTINGAQWTHHGVGAAMARSAAGQRITAILMGEPSG